MALWLAATGLALGALWGVDGYGIHVENDLPSLAESIFYNAFHRVAWSLALGWVIFACVKGYGGE